MLCLLAGCADMPPPRQSGGCIPGNPSGPPACQQAVYMLAP